MLHSVHLLSGSHGSGQNKENNHNVIAGALGPAIHIRKRQLQLNLVNPEVGD